MAGPIDAGSSDGIVLARPEATILDTHAMEWEDHYGIKGGKMKVLSRDDDGLPSVVLTWVPPGMTSLNPRGPERHYHRTVTERGLVLFGELPMLEYESLDDPSPRRIVLKPGYYLDRRPGSVHGVDHEAPSQVGFMWVEWRIGRSHFQAAEGAAEENVVEFLE